jgi:hypothetical protein
MYLFQEKQILDYKKKNQAIFLKTEVNSQKNASSFVISAGLCPRSA